MVVMFISMMILSLVLISIIFLIFLNSGVFLISMKFIQSFSFFDLEFLVNIWSILFLMMVIMISTSVLVFSIAYMNGVSVSNFIILYLSFIISMVWLILNNNFYWMMFGWDGLGVVSFLLIVFYYNLESVNNGLFTLFQNRLGDVFFVFFIVGILNLTMWNNLVMSSGVLVLILGASVKSAQFPFNAWLLAAMSAPTPISSLVHSSTLVVAGVFILLQYSYCLVDVLENLKLISIFSLMLSSFGLLNESDMKKLIAYSTMNHVSLMMYMLSFKLFKIVYFHLNIHAMFKSLMFMCFGFAMLSSFHSQDKRLVTYFFLSPVVKMIYYFSCMCLAGLPFLSGFFSKDLMIEKLMEVSSDMVYIVLLLMFLSMSIYYSFKLLFLDKVLFPLNLVEKSILSSFSILIMTFVMILFINIYLTLVFSLSLEMFSFKIFIYLLVLLFVIISLLTNLNYKIMFYNKIISFKEIWSVSFYLCDKFMFWNIFILMAYINKMSNIKLFLVVNWWVVVLMILVF